MIVRRAAQSKGDATPQTQTDVSEAPDDTPATSADVNYNTDPANVGGRFILIGDGTFMMGSPESGVRYNAPAAKGF